MVSRCRYLGVALAVLVCAGPGLAALAGSNGAPAAVPAPAAPVRPPFTIGVPFPVAGEAAMVIDDAGGRRVRNLFAQTPRGAGTSIETWDLRDQDGQLVPPGQYAWKAIVAPPLGLAYQLTPLPNVQDYFPDRVPWLVGHSGEHGWLSDHAGNWACAAGGDHVYFASPMAEAGTTLIECDLSGRRLWGQHDFGAWTGVDQLAADAESLFVLAGNGTVHRLDLATRKDMNQFRPDQGPHRRGWRSAMAARDGKVVFAYTGEHAIDNAAPADALDMDHCIPAPPKGDGSLKRLLRMEGDPPGKDGDPRSDKPQGNGRLFLESETMGKAAAGAGAGGAAGVGIGDRHQIGEQLADLEPVPTSGARRVAVIAFRQPMPVGSLVFPWPAGGGKLELSVLKADAPYPPRPARNEDWVPLAAAGGPGFNCVPTPPGMTTRAVRVSFQPKDDKTPFWRLDGMRMLSRRFANLFPAARVRVSSGQLTPAGEWDAKRTAAVAADNPGVYLMEWEAPKTVSGLAIQEIDGAVAEIDVWQGPAPAGGGPVPMDAPAADRKSKAPGWRNVATYKQKRRISDYVPSANRYALYLDGVVEFDQPVTTPAVRIRITEQWLDNGPDGSFCRRHDGRDEHGMHAKASYCMWLDTRVCKVMGVAVLSPLGDDPPRDELVCERLEVWDGKTGKLLRELPVRPGWHGLSFAPDGDLYVTEKSHEIISRVDQATGKLTPVIRDAEPSVFTIGPDGLFYIFPYTDDGRAAILVYDAAGKRLRQIGKPGGALRPGLWDPQRFGKVHRMCVDRAGSLWVLESQDNPRRIVQYTTDGVFVKELLGNTHYGGGGTMDRTTAGRAFNGPVEFQIDWAKHTSRIRAYYGEAWLGGEPVARRRDGHTYLVSAPLTLNERQGVGAVYLYDEQAGTVRLVAAMGDATAFPPLRRSEVISLLGEGQVLRGYEFLWFDREGNGRVDAAEVSFQKSKPGPGPAVGPFDERLGCCGAGVYYEPAEVLPSGVPAYRRTPAPGRPLLRLDDGSWLSLHSQPPALAGEPGGPATAGGRGERSENFVIAPDGSMRWSYPAGGGVSGLNIPPWQPGYVTNQFCIIGHEKAPAGELGEFFVVNDNTGQWRLWTADGLLAGNVLYHKADPRARFFGPPAAPPGTRLDGLSGNQEHFHGFFTQCEADGRFFAVAGFTHMSVLEVQGLDKFRRAAGKFPVSAGDLERVRQWQTDQARSGAGAAAAGKDKATQIVVRNEQGSPPIVDGRVMPDEWPDAGVALPRGGPGVTFRIAHDDKTLYLCWTGKGAGPLANDAQDVRRMFKTGACLDFQIGADPAADPRRTAPVRGDQRLLIAFVQGRPRVVLYQPVAPGSPAGEAWSAKTDAGGTTRFDRAVELDKGVAVAMKGDKDFTVEAAIPLAALGLAPKPGLRLRGDWGILTSDDGRQVKARAYWSNVSATGTADEAVEARIEPQYWGELIFEGAAGAAKSAKELLDERP